MASTRARKVGCISSLVDVVEHLNFFRAASDVAAPAAACFVVEEVAPDSSPALLSMFMFASLNSSIAKVALFHSLRRIGPRGE